MRVANASAMMQNGMLMANIRLQCTGVSSPPNSGPAADANRTAGGPYAHGLGLLSGVAVGLSLIWKHAQPMSRACEVFRDAVREQSERDAADSPVAGDA